MSLSLEVEAMAEVFEYQGDRNLYGQREAWRFMRPGEDRGDCEDFVLTVYLRTYGLLGFIWRVLILHTARIYFVRTRLGDGHAVGRAEGLWFDHWTGKAMYRHNFFERTGHDLQRMYFAPEIILKLIAGYCGRYGLAVTVIILAALTWVLVYWGLSA